MKHSNHITLSLVVFLCVLNFVGFSQDTIEYSEPPSVVRKETKLDVEKPQSLPKSKPFTLPKEKNPKVATWLSVVLPGAGQVYNGQWYKLPIIYGGAGALIYFHGLNKTELNVYQKEYRGRISGDTTFIPNPNLKVYSNDNIRSLRDYYQRNIELIYVFSGLLYILNIVDACVFAHLSTFDVSDNLSMRIQPYASPDLTPYAANPRLPMNGGLKLTFTLK